MYMLNLHLHVTPPVEIIILFVKMKYHMKAETKNLMLSRSAFVQEMPFSYLQPDQMISRDPDCTQFSCSS